MFKDIILILKYIINKYIGTEFKKTVFVLALVSFIGIIHKIYEDWKNSK